MKVLMLSTDASIFIQGSVAQERMLEYAKLFEELHVVVYKKATSDRRQATSIGNLFLYSTNTSFRLAYFGQAYRTAIQILKYSNIQNEKWVVTTQDPFETGLVGVWLKKKFQIPLQVQCHVDFLNKYFWKESLKNKVRTLLAKFVLKRADGIRVVSERILKAFSVQRLAFRDKIDILPIFVDIQKIINVPIKTDLHKKYSKYDFIILMASRLSAEKNIGLAIKAMTSVVSQYPNVLLLIVGAGHEINNLKAEISNYKLSKNIIIEPWSDDLLSYYKTADLFLLTSNYEGYGRTIIEVLVAGVPIVSTDVGIASEYVPNALGIIVPVCDRVALSGAILEMIKRKERGNLIVRGGVVKDMPSHDEYLRLYKESLEKLC